MKYIRTKDGIYDTEKYGGIGTITKVYDVDETFRIKYENTNEYQQVGDKTIIINGKDYKITDNNTANTIEELCDCFVKIKRKGNCKPYILKFDRKDLPKLKEQAIKYKDSPVYGAIHIEDKGLIFVAKMNEKGELELL